jgi:hypothetical protein
MSSSLLRDLQVQIAERLATSAYFTTDASEARTPSDKTLVVAFDKGDANNRLLAALTAMGRGAIVGTLGWSRSSGSGLPRQMRLRWSVSVMEIPAVNRTPGDDDPTTALVLAEAVQAKLDKWEPDDGFWGPLTFEDAKLIGTDDPKDVVVQYAVSGWVNNLAIAE